MSAQAKIGPDRSMLDDFVGALFRHADDGTWIALRAFVDGKRGEPPIFTSWARIGDPRTAEWVFNSARRASEDARPGNFCPPVCTFAGQDKADEAAIANGVALSVECDQAPEASRRKLIALLGEPTIVSASGGEWANPETREVERKLHLHWRLTEPTRDAEAHAQLKEARRLACHYVGADASAVPLNHPLRWPGSVHRKGAPRLALIVAQTDREIELADVLDKLRAACPDAPRRDTQQRTAGAGFGFGPDLSGDPIDIAAALHAIPNDNLPWDEWSRIAMATQAAGGTFAAFDAWSRKSSKYDAAATAAKWDHVGRHPATGIGAGTLFYEAQQASPGWRKPSSHNRDARREGRTDDATRGEGGQTDEKPKAKASRSKKAPRRPEGDTRPVIRLLAGELAVTVDEAEDALIAADCGIYQRGGLIVGVGTAPMLTAHRQTVLTPQIFAMGEHRILELMMAAAAFEKWDARAKDFVPASAPMTIPKTLQDRRGKLRLPVLSGLINAPTMRDDGSTIEAPGYDETTGLLYDPAGTAFPVIPDRPTKQDAHVALAVIEGLIEAFPFVSDADLSVALAAILTAPVRKSLPTAPAFAFTAPVAGSGKSTLVDIMSIVATGREAGVIAQGNNPEETEKRVASLLLGGNAVAIDNVEGGFGSELLCQIMTQATVRMRVLGRSETPELPTSVMVTATGNNMTVDGDMTRRTLLCRLDPKVERPELREFAFDPIEKAKAERGELLVAALTVLRAYHVAGRPAQVVRLGSFGEWSDLVRSALMWLGRPDPVKTIEQARAYDPQIERLRAVMVQWRAVIGAESASASDAAQKASEKTTSFITDGKTVFINREFREALMAVAGSNGFIEPGKLGTWLGRNKGRVIDGMRFEHGSIIDGIKHWNLLVTSPTPAAVEPTYASRRDGDAQQDRDMAFAEPPRRATHF